MKRLLIILTTMIMSLQVMAQATKTNENNYTIYSNSGVITMQSGKNKVQLKNGMQLSDTSIISIPEGGRLVLVDETNRQRFTISVSGTNNVSNFLQGSKKKQLAVAELNYLKKQLANNANGGPLDGVANVDRRIEIDSLMNEPAK